MRGVRVGENGTAEALRSYYFDCSGDKYDNISALYAFHVKYLNRGNMLRKYPIHI